VATASRVAGIRGAYRWTYRSGGAVGCQEARRRPAAAATVRHQRRSADSCDVHWGFGLGGEMRRVVVDGEGGALQVLGVGHCPWCGAAREGEGYH